MYETYNRISLRSRSIFFYCSYVFAMIAEYNDNIKKIKLFKVGKINGNSFFNYLHTVNVKLFILNNFNLKKLIFLFSSNVFCATSYRQIRFRYVHFTISSNAFTSLASKG